MCYRNEFEIGRKYGKTFTIDNIKYDLDEFKKLIVDNPEFYEELKQKIVDRINEVDLPIEEHIEEEEETLNL
jgi:hypothetical protein